MIKTIEIFTMICDNCGKDIFAEDEHIGYNDLKIVKDIAYESGWMLTNSMHYCPDCWDIDDKDNLVIKKK